jgi:hypothetical protein
MEGGKLAALPRRLYPRIIPLSLNADREEKMTINPFTRSDFIFPLPDGSTGGRDISLPTFANQQPTPSVFTSCTLPADVLPDGLIAFTYVTDPSHETSVAIHFNVDSPAGGHWGVGTNQKEFRALLLSVALKPGKNTFQFSVDKAGEIVDSNNVPHPFGGAGTILFQNIVVFFRQPSRQQENWRWCHKCQGLFFGDNAASSKCPAGGAHEATGGQFPSGDYQAIVR